VSIKSREVAGPDDPIWASPAPGSRKPRFTREEIAEVALRICDREGFDALSMRRVADELGAGTMTLYHYVRTKEDLITLMDDALMATVLIPADELATNWRDALAQIARASYAAFRRHGWAVEALSGARFGPNSLRHFEQSMAAIANAPFDEQGRFDLLGIVDDYVFGSVVRAVESHRHPDFRDARPSEAIVAFTTAQLATGAYPQLSALAAGPDPMGAWTRISVMMNDAGRFERGLQALLDGLELRAKKKGLGPQTSGLSPKKQRKPKPRPAR
jgi:AcrR family transcriptional regulator